MTDPHSITPRVPPEGGRVTLFQRLFRPDNHLLWVATLGLLMVLVLWVLYTPPGLLGKVDAVGFAVCHRIGSRSYAFPDGRALPMCARCSGTFLGVLIGMFGPGLLFKRHRAASFPPLAVLAIMMLMTLWWALDGANSFLRLLPYEQTLPRLYEPHNTLRLITGMFHGITMGSVILPVANAILWTDARDSPTIPGVKHLLAMYGIGALLIVLVLTEWPIFLYPLAILSALGTVAILAAVNTVMAVTLLGRENSARSFREALPLILLGLMMTFAMIGVIDALRFIAFGSWEGFELPLGRGAG